MMQVQDVPLEADRAELYVTFMSDVFAISDDSSAIAEIACLLRCALASGCDRLQWAALDHRLASLIADAPSRPRDVATRRLLAYLSENR